jgi:hypothetical protein
MTTKQIIEKNVALVEQFYPGLRFSNRWEWNHKVAYLSGIDTNGLVGQKSTTPSHPTSEDTIGILTTPLSGPPGKNFYPTKFEAIDLVNGSNGNIQWLSFGLVTQNFIIPTIADVSAINTNPIPVPPEKTVPYEPYWGDPESDYLGRLLVFDYGQRPQLIDAESMRWTSRVFHSAYMGPDGIPLGLDAAIIKHRPEWCNALGVPVVPFSRINYGKYS